MFHFAVTTAEEFTTSFASGSFEVRPPVQPSKACCINTPCVVGVIFTVAMEPESYQPSPVALPIGVMT